MSLRDLFTTNLCRGDAEFPQTLNEGGRRANAGPAQDLQHIQVFDALYDTIYCKRSPAHISSQKAKREIMRSSQ